MSTIWREGLVLDGMPRVWRPWAAVGAGLVLVLLLDAVLALGLRAAGPREARILEDAASLRAALAAAAGDARSAPGEAVWLLLGDSVLVGDSVREDVPDWDRHRVIDYLRAEKRRDVPVHFHQAALNGLLPKDLLQILRELDRQDPGGRVGVMLEVNLRYFSPYYAEHDACTRDWLARLAPEVVHDRRVDWLAFARLESGVLAEEIAARVPLWRNRAAVGGWFQPRALAAALVPGAAGPPENPLAAMARVNEHFKTPVLQGDFPQLNAFREVLARLRRSGRPALLFTPPLNDAWFGAVNTPERYGEDLGMLAAMVAREAGPKARLVHLDHPLFDARLFKDLAHMYPEGNRLLALNLLQVLGVPLATLPRAGELIRSEGPDQTLITNVEPGNNDGPPWLAAFRAPKGLGLGRDGRIYIADTGNHCLRLYHERLDTVRVVAGQPGRPGSADGPAREALLEEPAWPCVLGEVVYVADGAGTRLRRLERDMVFTERPLDGPVWREIRGLRARGARLYLLDAGARVLRYDPEGRSTRVVAEAPGWSGIAAFDLAPDGRLFVADGEARIWEGELALLEADARALRPVFANTADASVPIDDYFPFRFDQMRLEHIEALCYVPRYDGLLVLDRHRPRTPVRGLDNDRHFRLLSLSDRRIYPWLRPLVSGDYLPWNSMAETYVSPARAGSVCVDPRTATTYCLEENRSRLTRMGDGLWGAAKIGQTGAGNRAAISPDLFGPHTGAYIQNNRMPDRFLADRVESLPRRGPYLGLIIGPSIISASDISPHYSLARAMELRLQQRLGLCDVLRFDCIVRSEAGLHFDEAADIFSEFAELGGRADVAIFAVRNVFDTLSGASPGEVLEEIAAAAAKCETLVLFFDANPLFGKYKEGLLPKSGELRESIRLIRAAGYEVIDAQETLLRESLEVFPWGSPPYAMHHASPWAIERAADIFAERLYPPIAAFLRPPDRVPALRRIVEAAETPSLARVFAEFEELWGAMPTLPIPAGALQRRYSGGRLGLLLDLNKVPAYRAGAPEELIGTIAYSVLRATLLEDLAGRRAQAVDLALATFANYDEYGEGLRQSATVHMRLDLDGEALRAWLRGRLGPPGPDGA
jgi:hypothetical protein